MRCKHCGSTNIHVYAEQKSSYSYTKGIIGTIVFGAAGAVAGVNGNQITESKFECLSCGMKGAAEYHVMGSITETEINTALSNNDVKKLIKLKERYRNIEWNYVPNISDGLEIIGDLLKRYTGTGEYVTIPDGVTRIDPQAFKGCTSLIGITIPNSVKQIFYGAFEGCTSLAEVNIPNSVLRVDAYTFEGCTSLAKIIIPKTVVDIGQHAFKNCKSLKEITIPNSVREIKFGAFRYCGSLQSITIPSSVMEIAACAFEGCNLKSVTFENAGDWICSHSITRKNVTVCKNDLIDSTTAAEYLTKTYRGYDWKRK